MKSEVIVTPSPWIDEMPFGSLGVSVFEVARTKIFIGAINYNLVENAEADATENMTYQGETTADFRQSMNAAYRCTNKILTRSGLPPLQKIIVSTVNDDEKASGPSAGLSLVMCMLSLALNRRISADSIFTGTICSDGNVGYVGELHGKVATAVYNNKKQIYVPFENQKDVRKVPFKLRRLIKIKLVSSVDDILEEVFNVWIIKSWKLLDSSTKLKCVWVDIIYAISVFGR